VKRVATTGALSFVTLSLLGLPWSAAGASTLYERLGGENGVAAIAAQLIERVAADPVLGRSFAGTNLKRIEQHLASQLCELSGGPCRYDGDPMREVHAGHDIREAEFYGMVEALTALLKERHVALADRNALLRRLAPLKHDIVRVPAGPA
jgi:hemoglobin